MKTFFRANVASLSASFCDYLLTFVLIHFFRVYNLPSAIAGTIFGGIVNFLIGRFWAFKASSAAFNSQSRKYFLVWVGNLILNSAGFYLLDEVFEFKAMIAKVATSLIVSLAYNYPLQKWYVFKITDLKVK